MGSCDAVAWVRLCKVAGDHLIWVQFRSLSPCGSAQFAKVHSQCVGQREHREVVGLDHPANSILRSVDTATWGLPARAPASASGQYAVRAQPLRRPHPSQGQRPSKRKSTGVDSGPGMPLTCRTLRQLNGSPVVGRRITSPGRVDGGGVRRAWQQACREVEDGHRGDPRGAKSLSSARRPPPTPLPTTTTAARTPTSWPVRQPS
jgi:hypothetical protein